MRIIQFFKGMAMGTVETVPGISSSTVAMLFGIYENIIDALHHLTTKKWKESLRYLLPILLGMAFGMGISVIVVHYLLENYNVQVHALFMGCILGMLPLIWQSGKKIGDHYQIKHFFIMALFFALILLLNFSLEETHFQIVNATAFDYMYLFLAGFLASIALVSPGISGALILMILGVYETALDALVQLDFKIIFVVALGVLVGILVTSKLIRYLIHTFRTASHAAILGLLSGSFFILFPKGSFTALEFIVSLFILLITTFAVYRFSFRD
ncbi:hypothetical protein X560_1489 [Listeria fleischmannii 1991]|uniref:Domain of uncharacterized function (DUF368) n=2 Tax=Listeria fleischmannii TaxID=1069827 RepID=A0A2X3GN66_9LIST|nr:DUF368 domain-containing protein [Listeria fleischmannii]EMG27193.1 hypothetical protein LFLEISCH_12320 [Listeria fleischmannii subsp. fleischmannii LU2006-1]KMT59935.1 hypothetical protein X560_1489 [Listeria fleischmannii 1991]SQC62353.1 Domain of uncharacterised function (DUF368) [Listeria fleischmannii subsp. fleischmannii]